MANIRLIMKFADGRLAWSERHWFFQGPATGGPPPLSPPANLTSAVAAANLLVPLRAACLPATSTFLGAVLSFDDAQRDGTIVAATGYAKFPVTGAGPVLDPELALLVIGESVVGGGPSYNSNFYVSPTFASDVNDQTYNPAGFPAWAVALDNYILGLVGPPAGGGWGYKAVLKNSGVVAPAIAAAPTILPANNTFQFSFLLVAPLPTFNQGDIVKITGVKQGKGATPRLNGRWFVVSLVGQVLTLGRKYFPPFTSAASVNYIGGGNVNTTNYAIVPYTGVFVRNVVKHNRGGTLGLPRGRARTRSSNV